MKHKIKRIEMKLNKKTIPSNPIVKKWGGYFVVVVVDGVFGILKTEK